MQNAAKRKRGKANKRRRGKANFFDNFLKFMVYLLIIKDRTRYAKGEKIMETLKAIESRKSARNYTDRPIDREALEKVLWAGNRAPLGGAFRMTVIRDKTLLREIDDAALDAMKNSDNAFARGRAALEGYRPLYGAPVLIILSAEDPARGMSSVCNAVTSMTLAATDLGLGSCFVVSPIQVLGEDGAFFARLGLPGAYKPLVGMLLGHAGEEKFGRPRPESDNISYIG
jgi:nitroreductase